MNFHRRSLEIQDPIDSVIPQPQVLGKVKPEEQPLSPKSSELDSMFNLLLSEKQDHKNQFAKEYLQRKIDKRLKEIEDMSNEKKRKAYIEDARVVLTKRINETYSKDDKGQYQMHFTKTPDPAYLRSKSQVMTDAEVLKQRMKKSNINDKADEIVRQHFADNKSKKKKDKKKIKSTNPSLERESNRMVKFHSTVDLRDDNAMANTFDDFPRMNTFENTYDHIYEIEEPSPTFSSQDGQDRKGKVIMSLSNLITKLENLTKELNLQTDYLTTHTCSNDILEKISQYHQLIESQISGTVNLTSFKYLQDSINNTISRSKLNMTSPLSPGDIRSTRTKSTSYISPEPSRHMEMCLSQPTYKLSSRQDSDQINLFSPPTEKVEQRSKSSLL